MTPYLFDGMEDDKPISRGSDPVTSKQGEHYIRPKLTGARLRFVTRLQAIGRPSTANEVAGGVETIRKRVAELVRDGRIKAMGRRKCLVTGRPAETFWIIGTKVPNANLSK